MVEIDEILVADPAEAWAAAGFEVDPDGVCRVGTVRIRLAGAGAGTGITGWSLRGGPAVEDVDGIPTTVSDAPLGEPADHPNGVTGIDHLVLLSSDLGRSVAALAALGMEPRRERDGELGGRPIRQIFFRLGAVILEVVGSPDSSAEGPATLWGITYVVDDIEVTSTYFGDRASPVKDAVQPGRRITTLRNSELGVSVRTALISPHQPAERRRAGLLDLHQVL